ncbi:hypothetical protein [Candidatus Nanosynbacter sp. TM7-076]|uniref:hypothetical protein n=1 Tax=Candidatus Nanosynbacter sp. TM7-076 TaxID=2902629 RepID=UPI001FB6EEEA|nr:hypothetical protein [Candidatus Nanosynbacter sp. TM7-076]
MMKLKLIAVILALVGLVSLLLGGTYLSVAIAVICVGVASPISIDLTLRWIDKDASRVDRCLCIMIWSVFPLIMGISTLQDVNILDVPLGATIDSSQVGDVGYYISFMSTLSIILATIAPWSPPKHDDED